MHKFLEGDRIHWYKYSADGIIMDGGYGTVVRLLEPKDTFPPYLVYMLEILCDGGRIEVFSQEDIDRYEDWE